MGTKYLTSYLVWEDGQLRRARKPLRGNSCFIGGTRPVFDTGKWRLECHRSNTDFTMQLTTGNEVHTLRTKNILFNHQFSTVGRSTDYYFDDNHVHEERLLAGDNLLCRFEEVSQSVKYHNRLFSSQYQIMRFGSFLFLLSPDYKMELKGVVIGELGATGLGIYDIKAILWAKDTELVRHHLLYHNESDVA